MPGDVAKNRLWRASHSAPSVWPVGSCNAGATGSAASFGRRRREAWASLVFRVTSS